MKYIVFLLICIDFLLISNTLNTNLELIKFNIDINQQELNKNP